MASRRLKLPDELVGGQWQRLSGTRRLSEISAKALEIRRGERARIALYLARQRKFTNEAAYLFRKLGAFWGTNNVDHQGDASATRRRWRAWRTPGAYGAQTNFYNDIRNSSR
jgi:formate dehydrogenase major subunit